jgi:8-oxo-dGTP diphosphatase
MVATIAAAVAAIGSWRAAATANETATKMASIERDRRHEELTPKFQIACVETAGAPVYAELHVMLTGGGLGHLDQVTIMILDETGSDHWARGLPDGVTQEQAEAFVWGPLEFNTGASDQVVSNRRSKPRPYSRMSGQNWDLLSLQRTRPGHWMTPIGEGEWRKEHGGPVRLLLTLVSIAAAIFDDSGENVLLIKRRDNGQWEPPGGVLELNEPIEAGLRREVREETGIEMEIEIGPLTGVYKNMPKGIVALVFRVRALSPRLEQTSEAECVAWRPWPIAAADMTEAYSIRLVDALRGATLGPAVREHDGVRLVNDPSSPSIQ